MQIEEHRVVFLRHRPDLPVERRDAVLIRATVTEGTTVPSGSGDGLRVISRQPTSMSPDGVRQSSGRSPNSAPIVASPAFTTRAALPTAVKNAVSAGSGIVHAMMSVPIRPLGTSTLA
jgi:hypothetical protein